MSFYNTTGEDNNQSRNMEVSNSKQEDIVLAIFSEHKRLSPSQALSLYLVVTKKQRTPITSIRRAISDLTRQGRLKQTEGQHRSPLGKNEWIWEFVKMSSEVVNEDRKPKERKSMKVIYQTDPVRKKAAIDRLQNLYNFIDTKT